MVRVPQEVQQIRRLQEIQATLEETVLPAREARWILPQDSMRHGSRTLELKP